MGRALCPSHFLILLSSNRSDTLYRVAIKSLVYNLKKER